ncbi:MAG: hypothetical protein IJD79_05535 [Clostridia bacterium]|nr:hypothetical protein [Clostridia bacterium]
MNVNEYNKPSAELIMIDDVITTSSGWNTPEMPITSETIDDLNQEIG